MRKAAFLISVLLLTLNVFPQTYGGIPSLSPFDHSALISPVDHGQQTQCKANYDFYPKGPLEITHILFKKEAWEGVARCIRRGPEGKQEFFYLSLRWLKEFPNHFAKGTHGLSAWYKDSSGMEIVPEFQISHVTFVKGVGLIARCHYRRDQGSYIKTLRKSYNPSDREIYATRTVQLKWLTFNKAFQGDKYEDDYPKDRIIGNYQPIR